jgi:hypothetical protein
MSNSVLVGNWSHFDFTLTPQAKDAFETAMQPLFGARYTPLAFASQVVAGTNYCFLCDVQYATPFPDENAVKVYIYQPSDGKPHHYRIVPISP